MLSLPIRCASAAFALALLGAPAARAATQGTCPCPHHFTRAHGRYHLARPRRARAYVSVPQIPRYDPAEVEAEVHAIARYRTPYPYPALFGPF